MLFMARDERVDPKPINVEVRRPLDSIRITRSFILWLGNSNMKLSVVYSLWLSCEASPVIHVQSFGKAISHGNCATEGRTRDISLALKARDRTNLSDDDVKHELSLDHNTLSVI